jgi:predicted RecA/RadA family phage recombinase
MAKTQIHGDTQIKSDTITNLQINSAASIASTKLAAWSADRNANSHRLTGLLDPTNPQEAATKNYVDSVANVQSVVAAESISAFQVITVTGARANSNTIAQIGKILGITQAAINAGFSGNVTVVGEIDNPSWAWTTGDLIYLNGNTLSTTAPSSGFSQQIGAAVTSTRINVELGPAVLL